MRFLLALAMLLVASPAYAQLVVPLTTADGRVACTQGMTGLGRPPSWPKRRLIPPTFASRCASRRRA
jgi:hypothetical protein